ncbi:hypothetical protein OBRU01_12314 [Operophtera brumata]|uniref:Uncharacterized protein n=1 Tax=Operophtera brumata TaxID=104452 RepID=A0A0L7LAP6_OPEBR|nr:hypothetical protein OBRU01_12314 [Operophtera brumata]
MNESEYNMMPPLFHLDEFDACLQQPGGTYCVLDGYSAHTVKHYNHTQIHRGVCVTSTCQQYLHEANTTMDLTDTLEACLNDSLWNEYQIEGKLAKLRYCKRENDRRGVDESDIIVAVVYLALILLNITGSFYDINYFTKEEKTGKIQSNFVLGLICNLDQNSFS